jgi:hypothetical protein
MKRFSEIQKSKLRRINESDESQANLPSNFEDMSKDELVKLMQGQTTKTEIKEEETEERVESSEGGNVVKFFSKLFESREMAHVYHLTVKGEEGSHAAHTALGDFYDGILGFIDDMIEIYQGQYGIIEGYDVIDTSDTRSKDKVEYFEELANFVKSEKKCFNPEDSHILNIVDEAVALIYKTLYKLKYNK